MLRLGCLLCFETAWESKGLLYYLRINGSQWLGYYLGGSCPSHASTCLCRGLSASPILFGIITSFLLSRKGIGDSSQGVMDAGILITLTDSGDRLPELRMDFQQHCIQVSACTAGRSAYSLVFQDVDGRALSLGGIKRFKRMFVFLTNCKQGQPKC